MKFLFPILLASIVGIAFASTSIHNDSDKIVVHVGYTDIGFDNTLDDSSTLDSASIYNSALTVLLNAYQGAREFWYISNAIYDSTYGYVDIMICPYSEDGSSVRYDSDGTLSDDCNYPETSSVLVGSIDTLIGNTLDSDNVLRYSDNTVALTSSVLGDETVLFCTDIEAERAFQVRVMQSWVTVDIVYPYYDTDGSTILTTDSTTTDQDWVRPVNTSDVMEIPYVFDTSFSQGTVTVRCESIGLPVCQEGAEVPCVVGV